MNRLPRVLKFYRCIQVTPKQLKQDYREKYRNKMVTAAVIKKRMETEKISAQEAQKSFFNEMNEVEKEHEIIIATISTLVIFFVLGGICSALFNEDEIWAQTEEVYLKHLQQINRKNSSQQHTPS